MVYIFRGGTNGPRLPKPSQQMIIVLPGRTWQSTKVEVECIVQFMRWLNDSIFTVNTTLYITTWLCVSLKKVMACVHTCKRKCPGDFYCPWWLCRVHRNTVAYSSSVYVCFLFASGLHLVLCVCGCKLTVTVANSPSGTLATIMPMRKMTPSSHV